MWIFLSMENPLSESAFEQGIDKRPYISMHNLLNLLFPSSVLMRSTADQKLPTLGLSVQSAALYTLGEGRSAGESRKSINSSLN